MTRLLAFKTSVSCASFTSVVNVYDTVFPLQAVSSSDAVAKKAMVEGSVFISGSVSNSCPKYNPKNELIHVSMLCLLVTFFLLSQFL